MAYVESQFRDEEPDDLLTAALLRIQAQFPGWTPRPTHLEYAILAETTRQSWETRQVAADMQDAAFGAFGEKVYGIPPIPGVPASGTVVFTMTGTTSRTIPAGTQVLWPSSDSPVLFETVVDVANPTGSTTTPGVQVMAVEVGTAGNGLVAGPVTLVDPLSYVASAAGTTGTSGGQAAETDAAYLDRLSDRLRLLRVIPVEAEDFSVLARDVAGVHRALAVDNYNPADGTTNNERMVAIAAVDTDGVGVAANILADVGTYLDSNREVNFVVNTMDPTYTVLTVVFTGEAEVGADTAAVKAAAEQSAADFLSPALWAGGTEEPPVWRLETTVRYLDVVTAVGATPGLAHLTSLTLNGGTADVTLTGAAPLPSPDSTFTGTVT